MGKRGLKNLLIGVIVLGMVMVSLQSSAWAGSEKSDYSTESSLRDNTGIQDIKSYFVRAGENNKTHSQMFTRIPANISAAYKQNIFHYECPESGYYAIYATPGIDTVGALFEEQNYIIKRTTEYELVAHNDDQFKGFGTFGIVSKLDHNEDYYICVRGYGKTTGSYSLVIEPNEDKVPMGYRNYGVWNMTYYPQIANTNQVVKKVYLSPEQVILYYMTLDSKNRSFTDGSKTYTAAQLKTMFRANDSTRAFNIAATTVSTAVGVAVSGLPFVGITASFLSLILTEGVAAYAKGSTKEAMLKKLEDICGVHYYQVGTNSDMITRWKADRGLLAIQRKTLLLPFVWDVTWGYQPFYSTSTQMKGERWYVGDWRFD